MGIAAHLAKLLIDAASRGVSFRRTVTVGRSQLYVPEAELRQLAARLDLPAERARTVARQRFADGFLREYLGAEETEAIDYSPYQGAGLVLDMNEPLPAGLAERFDAVVDGGSLEHVFDVRQALTNCMELVALGGHLFIDVPANNLFGHGFYQFSSELFWRVFGPENGFEVREMFVTECPFTNVEASRRWRSYRVRDPAERGRRIPLVTAKPVMITVEAERVRRVQPLRKAPQQSDYSRRWQTATPAQAVPHEAQEPFTYLRPWQEFRRWLRQRRRDGLGNRRHFVPL
jgi:SAM-dependent methyltransferase